jgi:hypothetical protein
LSCPDDVGNTVSVRLQITSEGVCEVFHDGGSRKSIVAWLASANVALSMFR